MIAGQELTAMYPLLPAPVITHVLPDPLAVMLPERSRASVAAARLAHTVRPV